MLFQQGPADTLDFMIMGYGVIFVLMGGYVASLIIRWRQLRQDEQILEDVMEQDQI